MEEREKSNARGNPRLQVERARPLTHRQIPRGRGPGVPSAFSRSADRAEAAVPAFPCRFTSPPLHCPQDKHFHVCPGPVWPGQGPFQSSSQGQEKAQAGPRASAGHYPAFHLTIPMVNILVLGLVSSAPQR